MMRKPVQNMSDVAMTLHEIIKQSPGIHFRSLGREAGLSSVGQLRHHLDSLRRQGAIVELEDGRFKRFFAAGDHDPRLRDGLSRFARRVPRRIARLLLSRPMNRTEIRRSLNCADSTLGYHLNRMVEQGDLERARGRNCCVYSLTDPEFVHRLLQYQPASSHNKEHDRWSGRATVHVQGSNGSNGDGSNGSGRAGDRNGHQPHTAPDNGGSPREHAPIEGPAPATAAGTRSTRDEQTRPRQSMETSAEAHRRPSHRSDASSVPEGGKTSQEKRRQETDAKRGARGREDASEVPRWLLSG